MKIKDGTTLNLDSARLNLIFSKTNAYDIKQELRHALNEQQNPPPKMQKGIERKYLFNGKRKDTGEWIEGDLYYIKDRDIYITYYDDSGNYYEFGVIPETVGQFTGIVDKCEKKVFENYIVVYDNEYGKIVYHDSEAMFVIEFDTWLTDFDHITGNEIEVVGNTYDNPELLEGGSENA